MAYPILAPMDTWYRGTTKRSTITTIEIKDSYTPIGPVKEQWDASEAQNRSIICYIEGTKLTIAGNGSGKIQANANSSKLFFNPEGTSASVQFKASTILHPENLDMHLATSLKNAFLATNFTNLDLTAWDVSNVTNFQGTFQACESLETLDVSNWNVANSTTFFAMFNLCKKIKFLDLSKWNTEKCEDFKAMFGTLHNCTEIKMFKHQSGKCTDMSQMFAFCNNLQFVDMSKINTSSATNMELMFANCFNLKSLDTSNWNTSKVTSFSAMFSCSNPSTHLPDEEHSLHLTHLDTSRWDTSSCEDMSFMFYGCPKLQQIDTANWNVSKVKTFDHFATHSQLLFDTSNWKVTSACTHTGALFYGTPAEIIDISGFDFSNVVTTNQMFENCNRLKRIIGIEKAKTSKNIAPDEMFLNCTSIEELDLSNFDTRLANDGTKISANGGVSATCLRMFQNMSKLRKITLGPNFSYNGDGTTKDPTHYAIFPTPDPMKVPGADGKWYALDGTAYAPEEAPKHVPNTFFASKQLMENEPMMIKNGTLVNIGNGVSYVKDDNIKRYPSEMGNALMSIPKWDGRGEY